MITNQQIVDIVKIEFGDDVAKDLIQEMSANDILWLNQLGFTDAFEEFVRFGSASVFENNRQTWIDLFFPEIVNSFVDGQYRMIEGSENEVGDVAFLEDNTALIIYDDERDNLKTNWSEETDGSYSIEIDDAPQPLMFEDGFKAGSIAEYDLNWLSKLDGMTPELLQFLSTSTKAQARQYFKLGRPDDVFGLTSRDLGRIFKVPNYDTASEAFIFNSITGVFSDQ